MDDLKKNPSDAQPSDGRTHKGGVSQFQELNSKDSANQINGDIGIRPYAKNEPRAKGSASQLNGSVNEFPLNFFYNRDVFPEARDTPENTVKRKASLRSKEYSYNSTEKEATQFSVGSHSKPGTPKTSENRTRKDESEKAVGTNRTIQPKGVVQDEEQNIVNDEGMAEEIKIRRTESEGPPHNAGSYYHEGDVIAREKEVEIERRSPSPPPPPPPPEPIVRPPIVQETITRNRHIDHVVERARSPTPPSPLPFPTKDELQERNSWIGSTDVGPPPSIEYDVRSQSISGSTLVSALKNEDPPYYAPSVTDTRPYEAAREEFITLVLKEKRLEDACIGIEEFLQPETFEESFRIMFMDFAFRLGEEASLPEEKDAAKAASINRIYIANCVTERVFKMTEFEPTRGKRDAVESLLRNKHKKNNRGSDGVEVFKGEKVDDLDAYEGNELEGPINLLQMEKFIQSSYAWSRMLDSFEGWMQAARKAKQPDQETGDVGFNIEAPSLRDTQIQDKRGGPTLPFESDIKTPVAAFQVALVWAWAIKTLSQLYGQPSAVIQVAVEIFAIVLPIYATILLPRELVFKSYILCLLIPKAYMVYANALGLTILAGHTYLSIPPAKFERFGRWWWGSPKMAEEMPCARVKWHCTCGDEFHRDFTEHREKDAIALFERLCRAGHRPYLEMSSNDAIEVVRNFSQSTAGIADEAISHTNSSTSNDLQQAPPASGEGNLSGTDTDPNEIFPESTSTPTSSTRGDALGRPDNAGWIAPSPLTTDSGEKCNEWYLLCHDHYVKAGKYLNIEIPDLIDDESLMRHLRVQYETSKGWHRRHFRWSAVTSLDFSRFKAQISHVHGSVAFKKNDWGTYEERKDPNWSPCPLGEHPGDMKEELEHFWHYAHEDPLFCFATSCKHLFQRSWKACQCATTDHQINFSRLPPPSRIWTTIHKGSNRTFKSAGSWLKTITDQIKHRNFTDSAPSNDVDIELRAQGSSEEPTPTDLMNGDNRSHHQQQPQPPSSASSTHGTTARQDSGLLPGQQQQSPRAKLPHLISDVYPRRRHTKLSPNPTCYGWGLYLNEGFTVPTLLSALFFFLLFAIAIGTLEVALVDFNGEDGYDAFSLPSWAVGMESLVALILLWCCDRKR